MQDRIKNIARQYQARFDTEHEQVLLRLLFAVVVLVWIWFDHSRLPVRDQANSLAVAGAYAAVSAAGLLLLYFIPGQSKTRRVAWILIDSVNLAGMYYFAGKAAIPLLFFATWMPVDNGFRYGSRYLIGAMALSATIMIGNVAGEPYWAGHPLLAIGVVINMIILVSYTGFLIEQVNQTSAKLQALATRDILTNLPNRRFFVEHLKRAMILTHRSKQYCACVFLDLDGFKYVNDTHGHAIGDLLLIEVSRRIENNLRDTDMLSRFGGDEFAVVTQCHKIPGDAIKVSHRILDLLNDITEIGGCPVKISASIGISWYQNDDKMLANPDELIKSADTAMYSAKRSGKNCAHVIDDHGGIFEVDTWKSKHAATT